MSIIYNALQFICIFIVVNGYLKGMVNLKLSI